MFVKFSEVEKTLLRKNTELHECKHSISETSKISYLIDLCELVFMIGHLFLIF